MDTVESKHVPFDFGTELDKALLDPIATKIADYVESRIFQEYVERQIIQ